MITNREPRGPFRGRRRRPPTEWMSEPPTEWWCNRRTIMIVVLLLTAVVVTYQLVYRRWFAKSPTPSTGFGSFDRYLIINLPGENTRREKVMKEVYEKAKIPREKVVIVDGYNEPQNGHLGCAKSHVKCLKYARDNNLDNAVIMEDDFEFAIEIPEVNRKIAQFLDKYGDSWDVLQLYSLNAYQYDVRIVDKELNLHKVYAAGTTTGYVVNKSAFAPLIALWENSVKVMQAELDSHNQKHPGQKYKFSGKGVIDREWRNEFQPNNRCYLFKDPQIAKESGEKSIILSSTNTFNR